MKEESPDTTEAIDDTDDSASPIIYPRKKHCVSRSLIDPDALKIMYRLIRHGYKGYLVGGGVRDLLLKKSPKDFDIATDATPRQIKGLFRNSRIIGRRFKLVHIFFRGQKIIEVSTFRDDSEPVEALEEEGASNSQNNNYGSPSSDAFRRDLTINALFYDLSRFAIIDYVGGMEDLENKVIRVIGEPSERFEEDPVRMIRVARHAARAGFEIDPRCWSAIENENELINEASAVRVYEEIKKDMLSGANIETLRTLADTGLLQHLIPELLMNERSLLRENSFFSEVLSRVNESALEENEEFQVTPVFALMSLFFSGYPDTPEGLLDHFHDRDELSDHIKSCFIKLAVPRKERERIEDVLVLWLRLYHLPIDRIQKMNLERRRCLPDLFWCLKWAGDHHFDGALTEIVQQALKKRQSQPKRQKSGSGGGRRGKGRGGRGRSRNSGRGRGRGSRKK